MIRRLVILGATGDLASRKLLAALTRLHEVGKLPAELGIVGVAREDWDSAAFRAHMTEGLTRHAASIAPVSRHAVVSRLVYRRADAGDPADPATALEDGPTPAVIYLALPPSVLEGAVRTVAGLRQAAGSGLVIEKPFGEDLASARRLNPGLGASVRTRAPGVTLRLTKPVRERPEASGVTFSRTRPAAVPRTSTAPTINALSSSWRG